MTDEQRALERLARAALPDFDLVDIAVGGGERATQSVPAFIYAASPATALDLLATIARLEADRGRASSLLEAVLEGRNGARDDAIEYLSSLA